MQLHFYASIETINGIHKGNEMMVKTKESKSYNDVHVSFDMNFYTVTKIVDSVSLYKVKKK